MICIWIKKGIMKKIITYWTFDLIHVWHIRLLKRAKNLWTHLTVWISSDEFNTIKWKKSEFSFDHRKEIIKSVKYVDKVIKENNWEQKIEDIKKYNIDIFVIWNDWKWKFDYLKKYCEVIYLERTEKISSTLIKNNLIKWK